MNLTVSEIIQATAGTMANSEITDLVIAGVNTDTRSIKKKELFVPLVGEKFDGHSFIETAEENGAVIALWQKDKEVPTTLSIPLILVDDTLVALQGLANFYRKKVNPIVIGVTGSNGKTSTKDLIHSVLAKSYRVHKTQGNLNNHIGVPLTILSMPEDTEVAIIEMGMSQLGEIELLSKIAEPQYAVITNIGESHLEYLKTRENIAKAKLEITSGLKTNGTLILFGDEPLLRDEIKKVGQGFSVIWVGYSNKNDIYPVDIKMEDVNKIGFIDNHVDFFELSLIGKHNVINALMAIQIAKFLNVGKENIQWGLDHIKMTGMRLERLTSKNGSVILNDAYNASPTSMKAGLELLASFKEYKKIAVLGDMLELGSEEREFHEEIGKHCAQLAIDLLLTTGNLGQWIESGAISHGMPSSLVYYNKDLDKIADFILANSDSSTMILVKGSRGVHLEKVVNKLI